MKKYIAAFILIISNLNFAQNAGSTGLAFLKFGLGPRNLAMGDIGVVSARDITALHYNPAMLSFNDNPEIIFMHSEWIQEVKSEYLGASYRIWNIPIAAGLNTVSIDGFEFRDRPGEAQASFGAHYFNLSFSSSFKLTDDISIGATYKYIYEKIFTDDAGGYAIDIGAYYVSPIKELTIGAAFRNMGSMDELRYEATKMPAEFRFGALYEFVLEKAHSKVSLGSQTLKYFESGGLKISFGGEYLYDELFAFRLGYMASERAKGITVGVGAFYLGISFDYAFVPFNYDLGAAHLVSLKYTF